MAEFRTDLQERELLFRELFWRVTQNGLILFTLGTHSPESSFEPSFWFAQSPAPGVVQGVLTNTGRPFACSLSAEARDSLVSAARLGGFTLLLAVCSPTRDHVIRISLQVYHHRGCERREELPPATIHRPSFSTGARPDYRSRVRVEDGAD